MVLRRPSKERIEASDTSMVHVDVDVAYSRHDWKRLLSEGLRSAGVSAQTEARRRRTNARSLPFVVQTPRK